MPAYDRPPRGLRLAKAVREFSDPELVTVDDRAHGAARRPRIRTTSFEDWGRVQAQDDADRRTKKKSREALFGNFWGLVKTTGDVIAIGCPSSVDKPAREIPRREWCWLPTKPGKDGRTFIEENGRTWYRVLFHRREDVEAWRTHRRKSRSSQRRVAALVRVEMNTTAAGPDGMLEPGHTYDLPKDVAEPLITSSAARMTEEQPSVPELDAADPKYPGPWSKSERLAGIPLNKFVEWWSPARCEEISYNWVPSVVAAPMTFEEERRDKQFWQAIERLRHDLDRARVSGWTFGRLPKDPEKEPKPFSAAMQYEFIENVCLQPIAWCAFDYHGESMEVRVFPPGRFEDKTEAGSGRDQNIVPSAKAEKDCFRWLQAERAAGPPQMAKKGYRQTARERFKRLSGRGFDRAWGNAVGHDDRWTRAGPKLKAPKA